MFTLALCVGTHGFLRSYHMLIIILLFSWSAGISVHGAFPPPPLTSIYETLLYIYIWTSCSVFSKVWPMMFIHNVKHCTLCAAQAAGMSIDWDSCKWCTTYSPFTCYAKFVRKQLLHRFLKQLWLLHLKIDGKQKEVILAALVWLQRLE